MIFSIVLKTFFFLYSFTIFAKDSNLKTFFFFQKDKLGAHAFYDPISFSLEAGFEAAYDNELDKIKYKAGIKNVLKSIRKPLKTIEKNGGYKKFILNEVLPASKSGAWVPNYTWHLLGGGFRTRLLSEYFQNKQVSYPNLYAWIFMYIGHFMNEVHQATDSPNGSIDAIADLLIFDWLGKIIFLNDKVSKFAAQTAHLKDWTYRMSYGLLTNRLLNNGQQYWLRFRLLDWLSLSFLSGNMHSSPCITFNYLKHQLSFGVGIKLEDFITKKNGSPEPTSTEWALLIAYSLADNPFITLNYRINYKSIIKNSSNKKKMKKITLNIYPSEKISILGINPGLTFGLKNNSYFLGITTPSIPIGIHL